MTNTVTPGHTNLRNMHPTLFKSLALMSVMLILGGLVMLTQGGYNERQTGLAFSYIPIQFWGVLFTLAGGLIGYGILNTLKRYKFARYGLIFGSSICGVWGVSYFFALFHGGGSEAAPLAAIFFSYLSGTLMIWAGEPAFNPLASALRQKGTNVAGSGRNE